MAAARFVQELHIKDMDIHITIEAIHTIAPQVHFAPHYLSNLDDMVGVRVLTPTIYFYRPEESESQGDSIFRVMKEALVKVLVPYYPFAGRIRELENGKLEVFFDSNQGILFIEANSDATLPDLGDLSVPNPAWRKLIHSFPDEEPYKVVNMPLVIAQVTKFKCGGFSLGLRLCHCLCDGLGAMQFLSAWAETAKSKALVVDPEPCWDREIFLPRNPPRIEFEHNEFKSLEEGSNLTKCLWEGKLVQKCYKISRDYQVLLKLLAQANGELCCTSFDAMAAHVWRCWVRAMKVEPLDYELRLTFSVNARGKIKDPPLRNGFYGNVLCVACTTTTVNRLVHGSLSETARLVHEARSRISEEYLRSTIDYIDIHRPKRLEFGGKLSITQWNRFPMYESADFGWGEPVYVGPMDLTPTPQMCVFLPEGRDKEGMMLCICLTESAAHSFGTMLMEHAIQ